MIARNRYNSDIVKLEGNKKKYVEAFKISLLCMIQGATDFGQSSYSGKLVPKRSTNQNSNFIKYYTIRVKRGKMVESSFLIQFVFNVMNWI